MSKKVKIDKTNVMRILDQLNIAYEPLSYPCHDEVLSGIEVADYLGVSANIVYKTLVAMGDKTGVIVAIIPSDSALNLKALAKVSHNKNIEMIAVKDIEKITGYIRGGCSPISMKRLFPTFLAGDSKEQEAIIISAGKRGFQVKLAPEALSKIIPIIVADITEND